MHWEPVTLAQDTLAGAQGLVTLVRASSHMQREDGTRDAGRSGEESRRGSGFGFWGLLLLSWVSWRPGYISALWCHKVPHSLPMYPLLTYASLSGVFITSNLENVD